MKETSSRMNFPSKLTSSMCTDPVYANADIAQESTPPKLMLTHLSHTG